MRVTGKRQITTPEHIRKTGPRARHNERDADAIMAMTRGSDADADTR